MDKKSSKMEYEAPDTTFFTLSEKCAICATSSKGASVESFTEDSPLSW